MKWARKAKTNGTAREGTIAMRSHATIANGVPRMSDKWVITNSSKRSAVKVGAKRALKQFQMELRHLRRKKR